ncbi:hypothetical protein CLOSTMETH_01615 [[Clostridium] methylpentosum DSM 5476]|uniref:Uncharacterized protein n=1 Tax=[Clostridium] methylpentosum DSM 5476 TaxID=537013 RepID=C0ECP4_9FIRM|nr:hypothetical protein CLOSTMETH_01615 [[Clostridium] methylpentosum DSM 5476]
MPPLSADGTLVLLLFISLDAERPVCSKNGYRSHRKLPWLQML